MGSLVGVRGPWCGYRMGDAKYVASIKTDTDSLLYIVSILVKSTRILEGGGLCKSTD